MSTRALAITAILLGAVLALVVSIALRGQGGEPSVQSWEFRNTLLDCKPGTLAILRPGRLEQPRQRYWFLRVIREPQFNDPAAVASEVGGYAHVRAGVWSYSKEQADWFYQAVAFFAFRQIGSLGAKQWLNGIRMVREVDASGNERELLRATFQNTGGALSHYFYDPRESAEDAAKRGLGWVHALQEAKDAQSQVYYLEPAGFREPPPRKK